MFDFELNWFGNEQNWEIEVRKGKKLKYRTLGNHGVRRKMLFNITNTVSYFLIYISFPMQKGKKLISYCYYFCFFEHVF